MGSKNGLWFVACWICVRLGQVAFLSALQCQYCIIRACLGAKYLNTIIFECRDITMVYHGIFYINPPTHVWRQSILNHGI
jgi:hypothetical protein